MARWTNILAIGGLLTGTLISVAAPVSSFTLERPEKMDRGIGETKVGSFENGIESRRGRNNSRVETRTPYGTSGPSATAVGNLINIQAGNNSTVILNAEQHNFGNQTALNGSLKLD